MQYIITNIIIIINLTSNKNQAMPRMIAASPVTKEKLESELRIMQVELNRNLTMDEFLNELLGRYQAKKV